MKANENRAPEEDKWRLLHLIKILAVEHLDQYDGANGNDELDNFIHSLVLNLNSLKLFYS